MSLRKEGDVISNKDKLIVHNSERPRDAKGH